MIWVRVRIYDKIFDRLNYLYIFTSYFYNSLLMCAWSCSWSPEDCNDCNFLKYEIIAKLWNKLNKSDLKALDTVFDYIKELPEKVKNPIRKNGEHYLVHLIETTRILLDISSGLTLEQVAIALLHDAIEDVKENDINELTILFWHKIAPSVKKLSKKDIPNSGYSKERYQELKRERNIEYLESLKDLDDFELDVKFADRIHNLRTLIWLPREDIELCIEDTIKYFVPLAKLRNKKAYKLLMSELIALRVHLVSQKANSKF